MFKLINLLIYHPIISIIVIVGGIWWWRKRVKPEERALRGQYAPLSLTQDGEWTVISARANRPPLNKRYIYAGVCIIFLGLFVGAIEGGGNTIASGGYVIAIGGFLVCLAVSILKSRVVSGQPGPFSVKADAVRIPDGTIIPSASIYRLQLKNVISGQEIGGFTSTIMAGPLPMMAAQAIGGAARSVGLAAELKWQKDAARVGNTLVVEHQGTSTMVASAMTSEQAFAVLQETKNRLDGFH